MASVALVYACQIYTGCNNAMQARPRRIMNGLLKRALDGGMWVQRVVPVLALGCFCATVDARGEHAFLAPWPKDVVVSAKTGRANDRAGRGIR